MGYENTKQQEKEQYWHSTVERWRTSGISQVEFCKNEQLNPKQFYRWRSIFEKRVAGQHSTQKTPPSQSRNKRGNRKLSVNKPRFIKVDVTADRDFNNRTEQTSRNNAFCGTLAAELIEPIHGRTLRIFNGADPLTLSALVTALSL